MKSPVNDSAKEFGVLLDVGIALLHTNGKIVEAKASAEAEAATQTSDANSIWGRSTPSCSMVTLSSPFSYFYSK